VLAEADLDRDRVDGWLASAAPIMPVTFDSKESSVLPVLTELTHLLEVSQVPSGSVAAMAETARPPLSSFRGTEPVTLLVMKSLISLLTLLIQP
jgi:hypothetical protein